MDYPVTLRQTSNVSEAYHLKSQTTQLILLHAAPIEVTFRTDEKRFDVEGSYNIRYQIIKKRIDKVKIKDSTERLTKPGTVSLVYLTENDLLGYQELFQAMLHNKKISAINYLDLEDLQGVSGLKAVRTSL